MPEGFDDVQLPPLSQAELFRDLPVLPADGATPAVPGVPPLPPSTQQGIGYLREMVAAATARAFAPQLVLVDGLPGGAGGEFGRALRELAELTPRPLIALGLPDIVGDPREVRRRWTSDGSEDLLETIYDRVLVYGDPRLFDPVRELRLSPAIAAKVTVCGYLPPEPPARSAAEIRAALGTGDAPLLLCTTGGGVDGGVLLRAVLDALARPVLTGLHACLIAGPYLAAAELTALQTEASQHGGVRVLPFVEDLPSYLHAADVVVSMGGYGTVREAVGLGKRPLIVPRVTPGSDQQFRAERFAALGLATWLHPAGVTPERLARAIRDALDAGFTPAPFLDFDGLRRAGDLLAAVLSPE
jgi:predicted glycosyltransferase